MTDDPEKMTIEQLVHGLCQEVDVVRQEADPLSNAEALAANRERLRRLARSIEQSRRLVRSRQARLRRRGWR